MKKCNKSIKNGLLCIFFAYFLCPFLGFCEPLDNVHLGTVDNPTIDGGWVNAQKKQKQLKSENKWNETHIESVLEKAAEGGKLTYVLKAAKRYQLPASVALIPIVESRYETNAISPKGAAGLWQLSQAVASDFSLPHANRFNWKASTEVALKHLKHLHEHYGRWDYTWAAYNAGQGRVDRALRQMPDGYDVNILALPRETKDYVNQLTTLQDVLSRMFVEKIRNKTLLS